MRAMTEETVGGDPWAPFEPNAEAPWDLRRVVHLHRRAGFGATWEEIGRDLDDGPGPSVDRLLRGDSRIDGVPEGFGKTAELLADAAVASNDPNRLKAWWMYRILFGPDPLGERLTLMWHDHFATSNLKVDDLGLMRSQNETLRSHARGPFGDMLGAMVHDPALLVWLDAPSNRKGRPNENLARELLELFALGVGRYTEADVKESARALTGLGRRGPRPGARRVEGPRRDCRRRGRVIAGHPSRTSEKKGDQSRPPVRHLYEEGGTITERTGGTVRCPDR